MEKSGSRARRYTKQTRNEKVRKDSICRKLNDKLNKTNSNVLEVDGS